MTHRLYMVKVSALVLLVSGCASFIADEIENAKLALTFTTSNLEKLYSVFDVSTRHYCSSSDDFCTDYLYSEPVSTGPTVQLELLQIEDDFLKMSSSVEAGAKRVDKTLLIENTYKNKYQGTIVMLHGHGADKRAWLFALGYFNYLGFTVIAPDLPGHGSANLPRSYGVADGPLIANFIDSELQTLPRPLIVVGHSMGALAAVTAARQNSAIEGLMLLSPMQRFDNASLGVAQTFTPWLYHVVPDTSIEDGARLALSRVGATLEQTDLLPSIPYLTVPTLVYGAQTDPISNIDNESGWQYPHVYRYVNNDESHISVIMVGQEQHGVLTKWLKRVPGVSNASNEEDAI